MLFLGKRVQFLYPDGTLPPEPKVGAGSVLIAFGEENAECLRTCGLEGAFVRGIEWVGCKDIGYLQFDGLARGE